jgi:hypothetical protein
MRTVVMILLSLLLYSYPPSAYAANTTENKAEPALPNCQPKQANASAERYVAISSAALREEASQGSKVLSYLSMGKKINVNCQQDGWYAVTTYQTDPAFTGWLRADVVTAEEPRLENLLAQYRAVPTSTLAKEIARKRLLAERAVALEPYSSAAYAIFIEVLSQSKDAKDNALLIAAKAKLAWLQNPQIAPVAGEPTIIFINGFSGIVPLARLDKDKLLKYPKDFFDHEENAKISKRYYVAGRAFHSYKNGGKAGVTVVKNPGYHPCFAGQDDSTFLPNQSGLPFAAILSNTVLTEKIAQANREISAAEKQILLKLAHGILQARKIPRQHLAKMFDVADEEMRDSFRFSAILPHPQEHSYPTLILTLAANLRLPLGQEPPDILRQHSLRLIAEADAQGSYHSSYIDYQTSDSESSFRDPRFLTHVDLNQDGTDEMIFYLGGWEGWSHDVISKRNGKWQRVLEGADGGCY